MEITSDGDNYLWLSLSMPAGKCTCKYMWLVDILCLNMIVVRVISYAEFMKRIVVGEEGRGGGTLSDSVYILNVIYLFVNVFCYIFSNKPKNLGVT